MTQLKLRTHFIFVLLVMLAPVFSQLNTPFNVYDTNFYSPSKRPELKNFLYHLSYFPPLPRNKYEVGVHSGMINIGGNVMSKLTPFGIDLSIRKSLGYVFSVRGQYVFGIAKGENNTLSNVSANDAVYAQYLTNNTQVIKNYKTTLHHISVQAIANLTNIDFAHLEKKYNVYALFGLGFLSYDTKIDAYKGNELYAFNALFSNNDLDGDYETKFESSKGNYSFTSSVGLGVQYKISEKISLQAEHQITFTNTTQIDGSLDNQGSRSIFENNIIQYTSFGINFHVGHKKATMPLYWLNPLAYLYKEINSPRTIKMPQPKLNDTDNDGVADLLDREEATIPGVPVDAKGITLDTDGDGVPDYKDEELITPSSCLPVDEKGFGTCPNNKNINPTNCCNDVLEQLKKMKADNKVKPIEKANLPVVAELIKEESVPNMSSKINSMDGFCYTANLINSLSERVLFYYNSPTMTEESVNALNNIVEIVKRNASASISIQGRYSAFENLDSAEYLYNQRRESLMIFLYENGIGENRIKIKNIEDYNPNSTFFELINNSGNETCTFLTQSKCNNAIMFKADERYMKVYRSVQKMGQTIVFKQGDRNLKNFKINVVDSIADVLEKNPDYTLLISAPFETQAYLKDLVAETKLSMDRGELLKQSILNKHNYNKQIFNLPINSSQALGTLPLFRIVTNKNIDSDNDCVPDIEDKCPLIKGNKEYEGCLTSPALSDSFSLISKNILFDFDKDVIKNTSYNYLNLLAQIIIHKKYFVSIAGKTDETGEYNHNLNLSYARAMSVKKYLTNKNVPEKYLQAIGLGEQEAVTGTEEEKSFNRRVDFWINGVDN